MGARPANHPRNRLEQYRAICASVPRWPEQIRELLASVRHVESSSWLGLSKRRGDESLREEIRTAVFAEQLGERRMNTLLCDGLMPCWPRQREVRCSENLALLVSGGFAGLITSWGSGVASF